MGLEIQGAEIQLEENLLQTTLIGRWRIGGLPHTLMPVSGFRGANPCHLDLIRWDHGSFHFRQCPMQVTWGKKDCLTPATLSIRLGDRRDPPGPQQASQACLPDNALYRLFVDEQGC